MERTQLDAVLKLSELSQDGFIATFVNMWTDIGDRALDSATLVLKVAPEETTRIDALLRLSYRCAAITAIIEKIMEDKDDPVPMDPPQEMLDSMRAKYLAKLRAGCKGDR